MAPPSRLAEASRFLLVLPSPSDFVAVAIVNSKSHGINSMWYTPGPFAPDLTGAFTFTAISGCRQTRNGSAAGCGTNPPCMVP